MVGKASTNQLVTKTSLIIVCMAFITLLEQRVLCYVHIRNKGLNRVEFVGIPLSDHCEKGSGSGTNF
jgi:hypothetical protein